MHGGASFGENVGGGASLAFWYISYPFVQDENNVCIGSFVYGLNKVGRPAPGGLRSELIKYLTTSVPPFLKYGPHVFPSARELLYAEEPYLLIGRNTTKKGGQKAKEAIATSKKE